MSVYSVPRRTVFCQLSESQSPKFFIEAVPSYYTSYGGSQPYSRSAYACRHVHTYTLRSKLIILRGVGILVCLNLLHSVSTLKANLADDSATFETAKLCLAAVILPAQEILNSHVQHQPHHFSKKKPIANPTSRSLSREPYCTFLS